MTPPLVCIGFTLFDVIVFPDGRKIRNVGGGAYFVSAAASPMLKAPVGLVSRVGNDFDLNTLGKGISSEGIKRVSDLPSTEAVLRYLDPADLSRREILVSVNAAAEFGPEDIPEGWVEGASHIHLGSMPPSLQRRFLKFIKKKRGITGVVHIPSLSIDSDICFLKDPSLHPEVIENFLAAEMIFVNRHEAPAIKEIAPKVPVLFVKRDCEGAELFRYGELKAKADCPSVPVKNATGAGDVFAGTILALIHEGVTAEESLPRAVVRATHAVEHESFDQFLKSEIWV